MHGSLGDTFLLMVPAVVLLIITVFRLDEHIFGTDSKKKSGPLKPRFSNFDERDGMVLADPDGRVSRRDQK
ncbi:MAG TPA: hypothetical protein VKB38_09790 [Terracidiphilus sp.]|nr:hypothetical protein [Terracidiphilus sp.]